MSYLKDCWMRAKECIVLIPFVILPLLCYGVARGSETENEAQSEHFLPDTVKVEAVAPPPQVIEEKKIEDPRFIIIERGTVYNPEKEQTQGDPWQPAHPWPWIPPP